jgi:hypothetical protein
VTVSVTVPCAMVVSMIGWSDSRTNVIPPRLARRSVHSPSIRTRPLTDTTLLSDRAMSLRRPCTIFSRRSEMDWPSAQKYKRSPMEPLDGLGRVAATGV